MNKILLTITVLMGGLASAQIAKGTVYLSGQAGYYKEGKESSNNYVENLKILPTAGFFVSQNLAVGLGIGYTKNKTSQNYILFEGGTSYIYSKYTKESAFTVSPFARKYWALSDKLYFFGQLEVPLEFGKTELYEYQSQPFNPIIGNYYVGNANTYNANYTSVGVNIKPGLDYFITKNWTVEATVGEFGFNSYKLDLEGAQNINKTDLGAKLSSVTLGVKYVFTK
ncbi:porin family protein [Chryseobacterium scophthalmum]|uniref:porin family protein n=1 Tax=Chryseobacterium scophthalmum TaxID=59733 RepID=UPI00398BAD96